MYSEFSLGYKDLFLDKKSAELKQAQLCAEALDTKMIKCSICDLTVRGLVYSCPFCLHGGHFDHMLGWF